MKIKIVRFNTKKAKNSFVEEFEVKDGDTALETLQAIQTKQDSSLSFRCGCKTGVCGSCVIRVNGVEKLACKTYLKEADTIEALKNSKIVKDLVVDLSYEKNLLYKAETYLHKKGDDKISLKDEKLIDRQSNCILCQSCFSSCPVYEVNKEFLGPYTLTRAFRYIEDKKEISSNSILNLIQDNGVWDCTLCGNCTMVCPQFIDPKTDIINLRTKSVQRGFKNRALQAYNNFDDLSFDNTFNQDSGFNPNSF